MASPSRGLGRLFSPAAFFAYAPNVLPACVTRPAKSAWPVVSSCPTGALRDDPQRPMLRFVEDACVQCGLCQATCPEHVITLKPQIDFRAEGPLRAC